MKKTAEELAQEHMMVKNVGLSRFVKPLKWFLVLAMIVVICVFSWTDGKNKGFTEAEAKYKLPSFVQENMQIQKIDKSVSGKSVEQDQKDALAAAQTLINLAETKTDNPNDLVTATSLRMQEVSQGNLDSIPDEMKNMVSHSTAYKDSDTNNVALNAYNVLIGLKSQGFNNQEVVANTDAWQGVYVHPETGIAFVPLSSFADTTNALPYSMMMVYEDGAWKFLPQSLIESVNIAGSAKAGASSATPTALTSPSTNQ